MKGIIKAFLFLLYINITPIILNYNEYQNFMKNYLVKTLSGTICLLLFSFCTTTHLSANTKDCIEKRSSIDQNQVLQLMKKVADWQLANPTGKGLNTWDYAPFYIGLMQLYTISKDEKYLNAIVEMGDSVNWTPRARPYDANVYAITQVFYELYEIKEDKHIIDRSNFMLEMPLRRRLENDVTFDGNKYWWEWWSWCDSLFMAPPAYARAAAVLNNPEYLNFMTERWWDTSDYLYDKKEHLYFRDDRFFNKKSKNGSKIYWSRGNGWVIGGLTRVLDYMPKNHPERKKFEQQFIEMCTRLSAIQTEGGYWGQSLLDTKFYPQKESSGTAFFIHGMAWGVNNGLLPKDQFMPIIKKGWDFLTEAIHTDGTFGYVQEVGDSPTDVSFDDSESYGSGAFLLAATEIYKLINTKY